jgi:hypothetical protein
MRFTGHGVSAADPGDEAIQHSRVAMMFPEVPRQCQYYPSDVPTDLWQQELQSLGASAVSLAASALTGGWFTPPSRNGEQPGVWPLGWRSAA